MLRLIRKLEGINPFKTLFKFRGLKGGIAPLLFMPPPPPPPPPPPLSIPILTKPKPKPPEVDYWGVPVNRWG